MSAHNAERLGAESISDVIGGLYNNGQTAAKIVYAVVNTPYAGIRASALCAFSLDDIADVFTNSDFYSRLPVGQRPIEPNERASQCVSDSRSLSEEAVAFAVTHPLLERAVANFFDRPLYVHTDGADEVDSRYTHVAVDAQVLAVDGTRYDVLHVASANGRVHKLVNAMSAAAGVRGQLRAFVVETAQVFKRGTPITGLRLVGDRLIVTSANGLARLPVQRCAQTGGTSCAACVALRDPYCAWNVRRQTCTTADARQWSGGHEFVQDVIGGRSAACDYAVGFGPQAPPANSTGKELPPNVIDIRSSNSIHELHDASSSSSQSNSINADASTAPIACDNATASGVRVSAETLVGCVLVTAALAIVLGNVCGVCAARRIRMRREAKTAGSSSGTSPLPPSTINTSHTSMSTTRSAGGLSRSNSRVVPIDAYDSPPTRLMSRINIHPSQQLQFVSHDASPNSNHDLDAQNNFATLPKDYKVKQMYL